MYWGAVVAYDGADAGLGNRMRVTLGAQNLAVAESRALFYVWPRTPAFQPALTDLWDWSGGIRVSRAVSRALAKVTGYLDNDLRNVRSRQFAARLADPHGRCTPAAAGCAPVVRDLSDADPG